MSTIVMVRQFETRKTRRGSRFGALRLNLGADGHFQEMDAKLWDLDRVCEGGHAIPAAGDMIEVLRHKTDEYNNRPQWIIEDFRVLSPDERQREVSRFTPPVSIDVPFYRGRLEALIDQTDPERPSGLILREIFDRAGFRGAFYLAPAARDHHQNYPGGLLEHTINVTCLALSLADALHPSPNGGGLTYNQVTLPLDRSVLIGAGLLHDIGKLETYHFAPLSELTDANSWEGHLAIGYAVVRRVAMPFLESGEQSVIDETRKLLHCILSHHGTLEFGSPVVPACAEAFLLSQADLTDARLADIAEAGHTAKRETAQARWLPRSFHFPGGVFIGDWAVENNAAAGAPGEESD